MCFSQEVIAELVGGGSVDEVAAAVGMTEEVFLREELQLIKSAIATENPLVGSANTNKPTVYICSFYQVIDGIFDLRNKFYSDEDARHKHDFNWLHEAVIKVLSWQHSIY